MSDTPITDAAYDAVRAFTNEEQAVDALIELRDTSRKLERENAALRNAAVDVCILARVWVTVWGDKLSTESIQRFVELEKQILTEAQP